MYFSKLKILSLALIFTVAVGAKFVFASEDEGISLVGPLNATNSELAATKPGDKKVETEVKVEVSKFELSPKTENAQTLVLAKLYDTKQALGNSYVLHVEGKTKATILDPGYNGQAIFRYLENENLTPDAILLTNGYFFRIADNTNLKSQWPKLKIAVGAGDADMLTDAKGNQSDSFGGVVSPKADLKLNGGETIETSSSITWTVLNTSGFTPGSLSYQIDTKDKRLVFTGDFIYRDGVGGANLPMGNADALDLSLQTFLKNEPEETLVYPGFGPNTTVGEFYQKMMTNAQKEETNRVALEDTDLNVVVVEPPGTLPLSLEQARNTTVYQTEVTEIYPTTTYVYRDLWVPTYPTFGFYIGNWVPIRPYFPPPRYYPGPWSGHHPHHHSYSDFWSDPRSRSDFRYDRPPKYPNWNNRPDQGRDYRPDRPSWDSVLRPPQSVVPGRSTPPGSYRPPVTVRRDGAGTFPRQGGDSPRVRPDFNFNFNRLESGTGVRPDGRGSVRPGSVRPDSVRPDSVRPDSVRPDSVRPGGVRPDSVRPDSVRPGGVRPGGVRPGGGTSPWEGGSGNRPGGENVVPFGGNFNRPSPATPAIRPDGSTNTRPKGPGASVNRPSVVNRPSITERSMRSPGVGAARSGSMTPNAGPFPQRTATPPSQSSGGKGDRTRGTRPERASEK